MPDQGSVGFPAADPGAVAFDQIGDAGLLVSFASTDDAAAALAQAVAAAIESARAAAPAMGRPVPAQASVLIPFDPLAISLEDAIGIARSAVAAAEAAPAFAGRDAADAATPAIEVPVRYGGKDGPDLATVAELHGLRPADVVELHATVRYRVLFLGFAPGFGYLVGLPAALATPRRDRPRERVPAGSIGIAGEQTAIYPLAMPGGWHLIGRTDAILFDPDRPEPALLRPGSTVRFVPVADR